MVSSSRRFQQGQEAFPSLIKYWVKTSKLSLRQFCAIANWAANEPGSLANGVLSHIIHGNVQKISIRYLDLFSLINQSIWLWQVKGKEEAWSLLGPHSTWGIEAHWLDHAIWLPHPKNSENPITLGDFTYILAGQLEVPYLKKNPKAMDSKEMIAAFSKYMNSVASHLHISTRDFYRLLVESHSSITPDRSRLIASLLLEVNDVSVEQFNDEFHELACALNRAQKKGTSISDVDQLREQLRMDLETDGKKS